jgi:hypothetical protein
VTRAHHAVHGEGTVESWRRGGRVAVVRFESHPTPMPVPRSELRLLDPPTNPGRVAFAKSKAVTGSYAKNRAALTLEAMRLGVVPETDLSAYTVGRDGALAAVDADLELVEARGGAVRAFIGDYGSGKTHALELTMQRALSKGYLTAIVTLDPNEAAPSHPKRVYRALMRTLRYPDRPSEEGAGIRPLLDAAIDCPTALEAFGVGRSQSARSDESLAADEHLYLTPALTYHQNLGQAKSRAGTKQGNAAKNGKAAKRVKAGQQEELLQSASELLTDWLEGHPTISNQEIHSRLTGVSGKHPRLYSLCDYRPWARIYGYLLSGVSTLARAVGYAGLVVLLDEAEFYSLLSRENRAHATHLFRAWTYAAVGDSAPPDAEPLPFDESDIAMGGMGVLKRLPGRFGTAPGLYVVYAMTPTGEGDDGLSGAVPRDRRYRLKPLETPEYIELARRVCDFYASSRPDWELPEAIIGPVGKVLAGLVRGGIVANPRQAMKFVIELLDVVRFKPSDLGPVIRGLQQQLSW